MPLPKIPGCDFCGIVEDIDTECTRGFAKGDLIVGTLDPLAFTKFGSMAEFLVVNEADVARVAPTVSAVEAASVPLVGVAGSILSIFVGSSFVIL
jgi:NADPH:quinone reductase-like Zn-dependent oxidoreductase